MYCVALFFIINFYAPFNVIHFPPFFFIPFLDASGKMWGVGGIGSHQNEYNRWGFINFFIPPKAVPAFKIKKHLSLISIGDGMHDCGIIYYNLLLLLLVSRD